jgi:processive 1,2-diacylglycerol beta-glucosyltransferase
VLPKILILTCNTGEGHNSAARAIFEELNEQGVSCEVVDTILFKSQKASDVVSNIYSGIIKKVPKLFGLLYKIGGIYDKSHLPSPVYSANATYAKQLNDYIKEHGFNCVICTHIFAMEAMTAVKEKYNPTIKTYGVLTDYTAIPFYKDTAMDSYFAPNEAVASQLNSAGIPASIIFPTGIPVSPKYNLPISQEEARNKVNLPTDKKIISIMSGGAGCGQIAKLCKQFNKRFDNNNLILVFTGNNKKLKDKLEKRYRNNSKISVISFTREINYYIKASDVVLTKAGGLSSTEVAVANVPLVHLMPIPGCETYNFQYFTSHGMSLDGRSIKKAIYQTKYLLDSTFGISIIKKLQSTFVYADATLRLTKIVLEGCNDAQLQSEDVSFNENTADAEAEEMAYAKVTD